MSENRKEKKECLEEENCQDGSQQGSYSDGWIKGTTKNTGEGWKETGDNGKGEGKRGEE